MTLHPNNGVYSQRVHMSARTHEFVRNASHAGSWYSSDSRGLNAQLTEWLSKVPVNRRPSRAIISPHAGYDYSGECASFAYAQIDPTTVKRVFIIGPSHYLDLTGSCALTAASHHRTPLYDLQVDKEICQKLMQTGEFFRLSQADDEEEHSLEMQLPFLAKVMESHRNSFKIVPVLVGGLSTDREALYGRIFAEYLQQPDSLFVISSDFCHWGQRFMYTYYDEQKGPIWKSIQALDEEGMRIIERLSAGEFTEYLRRYRNTICGRFPIGIFLQTINYVRSTAHAPTCDFAFLKYAQSEHCHSKNQSSVSYAAGSLVFH